MNSLLQIAVCATLVLCIAGPVPVSGYRVNECNKRFSYVSTKSRTVYYTERYTYKCGTWGWSRCSGGRRASYTQYYLVTQYSTRVECCSGWRRDRYGRCLMAICYPSCVHGTCVRPNTCRCRPGYTGSRCNKDINECMLQSNSIRQCDHMCINTIGSYRCECNSGYLLDADRHTCNDVDECSMTRTNNCHQKCNNTAGSFRCDCYEGYTLDPNGLECGDSNECDEDMACEQLCMNKLGGFSCGCEQGYELYGTRQCLDINECTTGGHDCDQICTNGDGNFTCSCSEGYELGMNGKTCFDIDECVPTTMNCDMIQICQKGETEQGLKCYYIDGSYSKLQLGPTGNEGVRLVGGNIASEGRVEVYGNTASTWSTVYHIGWDINDANVVCRQLNYISAASAPRSSRFGYGTGPIYMGYINCLGTEDDIRQCPSGAWRSSSITSSHSNDAGVECIPYTLETSVLRSTNCSELLVCSQVDVNYTCACVAEEGHALSEVTNFVSDGDCNNTDPTNHPKLHVCRNSTGTLNCSCVEGYQLSIDNTFCRGEDLHNCSSMQDCKNTEGGYECPCKAGYLNKTETGECIDIDECSTDYMNCPDLHVQICYEEPQNRTIVCECLEGDINVCEQGKCSLGCTDLEVCVGEACTCYPGRFLNTENKPCKGGGCGEMIHDCTEMETCNNTIGGYECPCMNGFLRGQGENATCDDIDECREKTDGCHHLCMNGAGNYSCACVDGYNLLTDEHTCAMPMSLHEAVVLYQKQGDTAMEQTSQSGWLFPLGMICAFALIAAVVVGRKKSERFRNGTDRAVEMTKSLKDRIVSSVGLRRSGGAGSPQSNIYVTSPGRQPPSAVDDEMGDAAVYSANSPAPRGGGNQTVDFDDVDVYQVPTGGHNAGPSMVSDRRDRRDAREPIPLGPGPGEALDDDDDAHYLFESFGSPESIPNTHFDDVYESYDKPPETVEDNEELYLAVIQ